MALKSNFSEAVKAVVRTIPKGHVMTYQAVAEKSGYPKAARAVARVMATNYDETVPCHRVIRSDGALGGYNRGGEKQKAALLAAEGWKTKAQG